MSKIETYTPRYTTILKRSDKSVVDLPDHLKNLIERFLQAHAAWHTADISTKTRLLPALVQTDAFIAAAIEQIVIPSNEVDKIKLMAMKAKALLQKGKS